MGMALPFLSKFLLERGKVATKVIKILLVDDQRLFRQGLRSLLEQEKDLKVVGEAADGQDAFTLVQETKPDIILMDVEMPKLDGIHSTPLIL